MGQEIEQSSFDDRHFERFAGKLHDEIERLQQSLSSGNVDNRHWRCGFELEAWLLNPELRPIPANDRFIALAQKSDVSPELAAFNIELNSPVFDLNGDVFTVACRHMQQLCAHYRNLAQALDIRMALIGTLPTLEADDLSLDHLSESNRFVALNEQVFRQREGRPLKVDIAGREHLRSEHLDVMLESATTSFQVHLQTPIQHAVAHYNAALMASAATVAVSTNSPYLFGKQLWQETRIPLFEQAVAVGGYADTVRGPLKRVSFGSGYLKKSMLEYFQECVQHFPPLLPIELNTPAEQFPHLRLHNGTIWSWNRPLIGFEADGQPHIRLEHRVMPSGPTVVDMIANTAFFIGLTHALAEQIDAYQQLLPFATMKDNFYLASQHGLAARAVWIDNKGMPLKQLILETLLPLAHEGLAHLGIERDGEQFLDIVRQRVQNEKTGAHWQTQFVERTGKDMRLLTDIYLQNQVNEQPVHAWELPSVAKQREPLRLQRLDDYPEALLTVDSKDLYQVLPGPTLLSLPGHNPEPVFISVLLHGNETSGFIAVQNLLKKYHGKTWPRNTHIFIGNIAAARYGLRHLNDQADYNRTWPGSEAAESDESRLLAEVYSLMQQQKPVLSIDIHNNSGLNPHYACVNRLDNQYLQLALLFSRAVVYFVRPKGVQSIAFAELCPAVTIECGKVGDKKGIERAQHFIDHCLNMAALPDNQITAKDIDLFHTVAQVRIPDKIKFSFDDKPAHINFTNDLEYMNFREITAGTPLGDCAITDERPLLVQDEHGNDAYSEYFEIKNGLLRIRKNVMPSMLTTNERIIRQDCLCYLMERISPGKQQSVSGQIDLR